MGAVWLFASQRASLRRRAEEDLGAIARLQVDRIVNWRDQRIADATSLADNPLLDDQMALWARDPAPGLTARLLAALTPAQLQNHYEDILLLDAAGVVRGSVTGADRSFEKEDADTLQLAMRQRRAVMTDIHQNGTAASVIEVFTPVFAGSDARDALLGAIVLRFDATAFLESLLQSWPMHSDTGETYLVRRDGDAVLYLSELRFRRDSALSLRIPLARSDVLAVKAVGGATGVMYGRDYRSARVLGYALPVPETPWILLAKEDEGEILASWRLNSAVLLGLLVVAAAAAALVLGLAWLRNTRRHDVSLQAGEERYQTTLMSVGDCVIAADADGAVQIMNPAAEALTGWTEAEAQGRPLADVLKIEDSDARSTVLIARNGSPHAVARNVSPVRGSAGAPAGVVVVFRDVTDELRRNDERHITLQLLGYLNQDSDTEGLVRSVTGLLQSWTLCEAVGVRLQDGDDYPYFETRGFPGDFVEAERFLCERGMDGRALRDNEGHPALACMCGAVLRERTDPTKPFFTPKGSFWSNGTSELLASTTEADRQGPTRNRCNAQGYESVALIPLRSGSGMLGLLQVNDKRPGRFSPELLRFLENAADQIAIALAQRRARAALEESETHYRSLFGNMLNGFAFCKMIYEAGEPADFIYLDVNEAFGKLTGLVDVVGRKVSVVIPGIRESDPELIRTYGRVARGGPPERFETYLGSLDMWFAISVYCPRPDHFVAIFDVITERKKAEAGRQLLASAVEQAAEMIIITDAAMAVQYVNPAFESVTGYARAEVQGKLLNLLNSGEQTADFYRSIWETISKGKPWKGRFVNRKKDGTVYTEDTVISPVYDANGRIANYVADSHDITRELQLEGQLLQAQKMESVGRLAGGVAHDFNNMLQVISSYVEFSMRDSTLSDAQRRNLQQIRTAASRSADLTSQLLAFARKQPFNPKILDLNDAVGGTIKMLRRLIGENIELVWKPGSLKGRVKIDPTQLDQILANLSVNARDAIDGVGVLTLETVEVVFDQAYCDTHAGFLPGRFLLLSVGDDGPGMTREVQAHLFEPFFTTKPAGQGTGLGLATVYGIVKQNNGFINVYAETGHGSLFRIYLPDASQQGDVAEVKAEKTAPQGGKETILLVEDEKAILEVSKTILESLGYTVLTAGTPAEAIRLVESHDASIDLLVTDVILPQMNGRDLSRRLAVRQPRMKCLYISGYTADVIDHQGLLDPGVYFLPKPFAIHDLSAKIREVLEGTGQPA